jgi:hypothetical protein
MSSRLRVLLIRHLRARVTRRACKFGIRGKRALRGSASASRHCVKPNVGTGHFERVFTTGRTRRNARPHHRSSPASTPLFLRSTAASAPAHHAPCRHRVVMSYCPDPQHVLFAAINQQWNESQQPPPRRQTYHQAGQRRNFRLYSVVEPTPDSEMVFEYSSGGRRVLCPFRNCGRTVMAAQLLEHVKRVTCPGCVTVSSRRLLSSCNLVSEACSSSR